MDTDRPYRAKIYIPFVDRNFMIFMINCVLVVASWLQILKKVHKENPSCKFSLQEESNFCSLGKFGEFLENFRQFPGDGALQLHQDSNITPRGLHQKSGPPKENLFPN